MHKTQTNNELFCNDGSFQIGLELAKKFWKVPKTVQIFTCVHNKTVNLTKEVQSTKVFCKCNHHKWSVIKYSQSGILPSALNYK